MNKRKRVVIIGAGPGGICASIRLKHAGYDDFVVLDTRALSDFSALNTRLNAGGFAEQREIRVRTGKLTVSDDDGDGLRPRATRAVGCKVCPARSLRKK